MHGIYNVAIVVWAFLSQVLRDGKEASCQAAVARIVSHCQQEELPSPTADTGDYCRARAKISEAALRDLSCEVAEEMEQAADTSWLWKGRLHPKLVDGFT
ncbi:IS4 family transposase, partial [Candidatus Woesearchaeota archaeon]